jgi:nicotinamidase-related amidase
MPAKNPDLHGSVPDQSPVALLLIDVINELAFPEGDQLLEAALPAARRIAKLKRRARKLGIPAIYVNDNFGRWRSDFQGVVKRCLSPRSRGHELAKLLHPRRDDYFVLKPKHSAFFSTTLDTLLAYLGAETLILTGFAGNLCVLYSANDAYLRDLHLVVPSDCTASNTQLENQYALSQMEKFLKADVTPSDELDLKALLQRSKR